MVCDHSVAAPCSCEKVDGYKSFASNPSVGYMNHKRGDKLRVSDTQSVGRGLREVKMRSLWVVRARARIVSRITRPLCPALHGEGGLALAVNVRVDAAVFSWSRALGEVIGWPSDFPPRWEAVAGAGGFVGNLATQQIGKSVAAEKKTTREQSTCFEIYRSK